MGFGARGYLANFSPFIRRRCIHDLVRYASRVTRRDGMQLGFEPPEVLLHSPRFVRGMNVSSSFEGLLVRRR